MGESGRRDGGTHDAEKAPPDWRSSISGPPLRSVIQKKPDPSFFQMGKSWFRFSQWVLRSVRSAVVFPVAGSARRSTSSFCARFITRRVSGEPSLQRTVVRYGYFAESHCTQ